MYRSIIVLAVFMGVLVAAAPNDGTTIDGTWRGVIPGPDQDVTLIFNFDVQGDSLSGTVDGPRGTHPIKNGQINGNRFSFDITMGWETVEHRCRVVNDSTISLMIPNMQGEFMQMTLKHAGQIMAESGDPDS